MRSCVHYRSVVANTHDSGAFKSVDDDDDDDDDEKEEEKEETKRERAPNKTIKTKAKRQKT